MYICLNNNFICICYWGYRYVIVYEYLRNVKSNKRYIG